MLCWVGEKEQKCLEQVNETYNIHIRFAKNLKNFISLVSATDYLILSLQRAEHVAIMTKLVRLFGNHTFHILRKLDNEGTTINQFDFLDEENVFTLPYDPGELFVDFITDFRSQPDGNKKHHNWISIL
jgi:hypothetical protein